jgi:septum formation protein
MAAAKAEDVWSPETGLAVLAADTIVFLGQNIFGKPSSPTKAKEMLKTLSGRVHQVATAFCLIPAKESPGRLTVVTSEVFFRDLSEIEIEQYVSLGESMDKAGAYSVQGAGAFLIDEIKGSFTNVVGLPLPEVLWALEKYME